MQTITTTLDGKQVQTRRNLKKEQENLTQVRQLMVDYEESPYDENTWALYPDECLTLLEQLPELKGCAKVEWPEGEKMKVARAQLTPQDFNVKVNSVANWFELSGDIAISEDRKMKIADLVEKAAQSKGRFVQLSDNEFVRLTDELRRHIDLLGRVASVQRGKMRLSQFNVPLLDSLAQDGVSIDADKAYTRLLERISRSNNAEIKVPKTINADLRTYQKEGFQWMSRLALWGAGALLADDMGLGKTLQAITLLLSRAAEGPQLVVVPTSVLLNWRDEIERFAPSLRVRPLNAAGENRETLVREAQAFDIVITTYGLLSNEEELLVSRTWVTIVLDEAHTIKNRETKMSQSAMKLKADFRLLLTGTPLQNHVSELWNLMQFANPGLLGSFQDFTARFLLPIERDQDKERQRLLKRVITPFLLRRTKSEVLNELPEKTEITLKVDLSPDEWAFYDNIRQKALAEMEEGSSSAVQALAEITRLRQAACNVRLVEDQLDIPSSKMDCFLQLVDELHANHHRALVFSQFTAHLALVRERLDQENIRYLYLDGATPAKERIRLVEQFQQGDMPLFLISLKAGGLGLNLTAADYVVHLDPWWNPAIEEQASDRAYRIGQHKPVTVYRLIAAGTIEEKIIGLHATKRNMADALLEGGDISASLSREEMLQLLGSL
ncbi:MAG: SNF2-related protein, partial [Bacteroidales bacterium]|nr:SNF2-related protein [Bacteroidales bacterium]